MRRATGISLAATAFVLLTTSSTKGAPVETAEDSEFTVRTWQVEDGLPSNSVLAIAQTPDGYLWLGTYNGLVRFDGARFTVFNTDNSPGLESDRVRALAVDRAGALWIGTEGAGVKQFAAGKFRSYSVEQGLGNERVFWLCLDGEGAVWAAGRNGVNRIHNDVVTHFPLDSGRVVFRIGATRSGRVWAFVDEELQIVRSGRFEPWKPIPAAEGPWMRDLIEDSRGHTWAGVSGGDTFRWTTNDVRVFKWGGELPTQNWGFITEDARGQVWFGFPGLGIARFDGAECRFLGVEAGLSSTALRALFVDREDNLWVATEDGGLNRIGRKFVQNITQRHGLRQFSVKAICHDGQGGFWAANDCEGLFRYRGGTFDHGGTSDGCFWSLLRTREGEVWAGKFASGIAVRRAAFETPPELSLPTNGVVRALMQDRTGAIWIGADRAITRVHKGQMAFFTAQNGLSGSRFSSFAEDRDGAIWAGSKYGSLHRIWKDQITTFTRRDGLRSNSVRSLLVDDDGVLWVGTDSGLSRFEDGRFRTLTSADGLEDEGVSQLLDDGLGNLWVGCNSGIYRLHKEELEGWRTGKVRLVHPLVFGKREGLLTPECISGTQPSCQRMPDGKLYFVTLKSIVVIDPKQITSNPVPPPVVIQDVVVDGQKIASIENPKSKFENLSIPSGALRVEFHFAGLSFKAPERVTYRYKMEGYDDDWVDGGRQRFASYTRMPPSSYRFRVQAANSDGVWNEDGATLGVAVQPRFWQTLGFKSLCALGLVAGAFGWYQRHIARIEQRRRAQEAFSRQLIESQEQERKRIAGELHDGLSQYLQLIKNQLQMVLNFAKPPPEIAEQLAEITSLSAKAIAETRTITHALRPLELDHFGLTRAVEHMVEKVAASSGLDATVQIESIDNVLEAEKEISLYRIAQESLNNVVKHARATKIFVGISREADRIEICISDNGCGFAFGGPPVKDSAPRGGLGLTSMKERARMMGGTLKIQSELGKGTRLNVVLPARARRE
ncbi:MAG: hypothetical protein HY735_24205 [Verrucomicrobia bacterium]|nr:hypothetical protein [Verrucomicrobiota bacterium]